MNVKDIYETVLRKSPQITQGEFLTRLDTTIRSLTARYGFRWVILPGKPYRKPASADEDIPVYEEYFPAVCSNILFLADGDEAHKTDYVQESDDAYRAVWTEQMRGKRFVGRGYFIDV